MILLHVRYGVVFHSGHVSSDSSEFARLTDILHLPSLAEMSAIDLSSKPKTSTDFNLGRLVRYWIMDAGQVASISVAHPVIFELIGTSYEKSARQKYCLTLRETILSPHVPSYLTIQY